MTILKLIKMAESFPKEQKTLWEKEKLLATSNFSFSQCVFKRLVLQTHKNKGLFGKGLNLYQTTTFLDMTKLKAFADQKLNVAEITISLFDRVENTVGKGKNAGYQHFIRFPQCFQSVLL